VLLISWLLRATSPILIKKKLSFTSFRILTRTSKLEESRGSPINYV